jgi:pimeloyl-ACP methyl ester carboxylesterase
MHKLLFLILFISFSAYAELVIKQHPLSRNNVQLHLVSYQDTKAKQAMHYPDILWVHGLTYSSHQFDLNLKHYSIAREFAKKGFRVWLLDITGYGQSQKIPDGFIVNSNYAAQDINAAADYIIQSEKIKKINVVGWSWGTITSSRFAVEHPEKVNKLILFAPIIRGMGLPAPQKSYQSFSQEAALSDFQLKNGTIDSAITEPDVVKTYLQQVKKYDSKGSPNGGRADLFQSKETQLIPYQNFKTPVLFIAGDQDPYLSAKKDFTLMMHQAPKGSCSQIIQGGGHALFLEKPYSQQFQHDVELFLKSGCQFMYAKP